MPPNAPQTLQPEFIAKVCPAVFGCVGFGAAMYTLEPNSTDASAAAFAVRQLWARDDVSCGTSIPLIAEGQADQNSTTYCVGTLRASCRVEMGMGYCAYASSYTYADPIK